MIARGFRFKLCPTAEQEALFRQFAGVCRLIYNLALEQRQHWWRRYERETGQRLNYVAQARQLTDLRAEFDWIRAIYVARQQQALRELDRAFQLLRRLGPLSEPAQEGHQRRLPVPWPG